MTYTRPQVIHEKTRAIQIPQNTQFNVSSFEYGMKPCDPIDRSPPNKFIATLQMRMKLHGYSHDKAMRDDNRDME
jgi:hypothetical protein